MYGRTFGVVGMGEIGRATARKAAGLGFRVICTSRSLVPGRRTPEGYDIVEYEELLRRADVVSFHTALTPDTRHMLDAHAISLMKPDAIVVNTARGAVVDTVALAEALKAGKLWGAGIDVFESEPVERDHPLLSAPHTVLTAARGILVGRIGRRTSPPRHASRDRRRERRAPDGLSEPRSTAFLRGEPGRRTPQCERCRRPHLPVFRPDA